MWEALFKLVHSNTSAKSIRWNERRTSLTAAQSILCMCWTLVMKGRDLISDSGSPKVFAVSVFPHTCSWFSLHHLYLTHCSVVGEDEEKMPSLYNQSCSQLYLWLEEMSLGLNHPELCSRTYPGLVPGGRGLRSGSAVSPQVWSGTAADHYKFFNSIQGHQKYSKGLQYVEWRGRKISTFSLEQDVISWFSLYLALLLSFHMYELQGLYMVIQKYHLVWWNPQKPQSSSFLTSLLHTE